MNPSEARAAELKAAFRHSKRLRAFQREQTPATLGNGKYALDPKTLLGTGGQADTFEATNTETGYRVVVKIYHGSARWPNERVEQCRVEVQNFARVAQRAPKSVVVPIDFDRDPGSGLVYIVMSRASGLPLHRVPAEDLSPARLEAWMLQTAQALSACRAEKIRHGDLKPSNLLVELSGEVSVIDFGFSVLGDPSENHGYTPGYESPEQVRHRRGGPAEVGAPSDVYSFGVVFKEAWARWMDAKPGRSIPTGIATLLRTCLAEECDHRPTAEEIENALTAIAQRRDRVRRWIARAGIVLAAAAALVAGWHYWGKTEATKQTAVAVGQADDARQARELLLARGREERARSYELTLKPSATAVKDIRLLGRPDDDYLSAFRAQVADFRQRMESGNASDNLVLLLSETRLALFENRAPPLAITDAGWEAAAQSLGAEVEADLFELRGLCKQRGGKPEEALEARACFSAALIKSPRRSFLHFRLSASWATEKNHRNSVAALTTFIDAGAPDIGSATRDRVLRDAHWFRASNRLFRLGDPQGAYEDMKRFFKLNPTAGMALDDESLAAAHKTLAEAAYWIGRDDEAATEFVASAAAGSRGKVTFTNEERLALADCHLGALIALSTTRPDDAIRAADRAVENLPGAIPLGPFRLMRARIDLHRVIAKLHRPNKTPDEIRTALAELVDVEKRYEAVGLATLSDAETYEYALALVKRAGGSSGPAAARLDLSRRGVKLMSDVARRHPRYLATWIPSAVALTGILAEGAIQPSQGPLRERQERAREALAWCMKLEAALARIKPHDFDPVVGLALRGMHRVYGIQAAAVLEDRAALTEQARALLHLLNTSGQQKLFPKLGNVLKNQVVIALLGVTEEAARQYLRNPTQEGANDVCRGLEVVLALAPQLASQNLYAAAAAACSKAGAFPKAVRLQQKAIQADSAKRNTARLLLGLDLYENGCVYEP